MYRLVFPEVDAGKVQGKLIRVLISNSCKVVGVIWFTFHVL